MFKNSKSWAQSLKCPSSLTARKKDLTKRNRKTWSDLAPSSALFDAARVCGFREDELRNEAWARRYLRLAGLRLIMWKYAWSHMRKCTNPLAFILHFVLPHSSLIKCSLFSLSLTCSMRRLETYCTILNCSLQLELTPEHCPADN
jgi:hypothetical protein